MKDHDKLNMLQFQAQEVWIKLETNVRAGKSLQVIYRLKQEYESLQQQINALKIELPKPETK